MAEPQSAHKPRQSRHRDQKPPPKSAGQKAEPAHSGQPPKLRGLEKDSPDVRLSKTISWLLRHAAAEEGLEIRTDGYVRVDELDIVKADAKQRFTLISEQADGVATTVTAPTSSSAEGQLVWLVKANQGHSMKAVQLELKPITSVADIPSGIAVHGTTNQAWTFIQKEGLSKMKRNHIHLAQGVSGDNVVSGMRKSSQILIFVDVRKALGAGLKFELSDNGVVLTAGDETGYLKPEFFERVESAKGERLQGWETQNEPAVISFVDG